MYLEHFELKEAPFSITPDPRFVYLTAQHRDALAHLLFGITQGGGGGFVQLTGEVGTGKTTLCRLLMAQVPENVRIALVLNPMQQPIELLRTICDELRILLPKRNSSIKFLTDALTRYLLESYAAGLRVVLIIDEAQNLSFEALEQVRLLTNLETPTQKLLQIILLGQPELRDLLAQEQLRQLAQRITARFHLAPLTPDETACYIEHRLAVAGRKKPLFSQDALRELHRRTQGYPRAINVVADRALLGGYARTQSVIEASMVKLAADEVGGPLKQQSRAWLAPGMIVAILAIGVLVYTLSDRFTVVAPQPQTLDTSQADSRARTPSAARPLWFEEPEPVVRIVAGWWGLESEDEAVRCSDSGSASVLCARLRLNVALLRDLDRPLVLELRGQGARHWLGLRGLTDQTASLAGQTQPVEHPWQTVEKEWFGDVILVSPRPDSYDASLLAVGATGPVVELVHSALSVFDDTIALDPGRYGEDTAERIRRLQSHYGLRDDGLVGPATMALLVALLPEGPKLTDHVDPQAFVSAPQP